MGQEYFGAPLSLLGQAEDLWPRARLHEIKHDGFRVIVRKEGEWVKPYSRPGNDLTAGPGRAALALLHPRRRRWLATTLASPGSIASATAAMMRPCYCTPSTCLT